MADDLTQAISDSASGPAKVTADGVTVAQHPLAGLIAADKYLAQKQAALNPAASLTRVKIISPGAVNRCFGPGRMERW